MASRFVIDATAETFAPLVLGNSERGLVLAYFWSPRAGPCMVFMPRLIQLAEAYGGRFLLVRVNTDELGPLAREWGVVSLPTVKFFRHGKVVETLLGVEAEPVLRAALDRHLPRPRSAAQLEAVRLFRQGQVEAAYARLAQAALDSPDDPRPPLDLARLMVQHGEHARAHALLEHLPAALASHPEIENLHTHLTLILAADGAPEISTLDARVREVPDDYAARFQRAARHLLADAYGEALEDLLAIVEAAPEWRQGLARRAAQAVLALPGVADVVGEPYRRRLAALKGQK